MSHRVRGGKVFKSQSWSWNHSSWKEAIMGLGIAHSKKHKKDHTLRGFKNLPLMV